MRGSMVESLNKELLEMRVENSEMRDRLLGELEMVKSEKAEMSETLN